MRVLLVDTDATMARLLRSVAVQKGYELTIVEKGAAAIRAALTNDFDLLLCDLDLPDMQGGEVVRALKAQAPHLPVIIVSALAPEAHRDIIEEVGASCFLPKPVAESQLLREMVLVSQARTGLDVVLIDPDPIHRVHMTKMLRAAGSTVRAFSNAALAKAATAALPPSLILFDASLDDAHETLLWARQEGTPAFIYAEPEHAQSEGDFMRAGASLFLTKPINSDALLTQARFLANF